MATVAGLETLLGTLGLETPVPQFPAADVLAKPIDVFRGYLAALLGPILTLDASAIYAAIASTSDITLGDLDVIIPRLRLSTEDVQKEFMLHKPSSPLFQKFLVDGVHIRCFFSPQNLPVFLLPYIKSRGALYGRETQLGLKDPNAPEKGYSKVVVEFSSPNIPSEFDDKYLRSTMIGSFVSNLYESMGCEVTRLNYLGDWGKQIGLLAVGWQRYGKEDALAEDPIGHLLDIKALIESEFRPEVKAIKDAKEANQDVLALESQGIFGERDAFFKKMEDGDQDALALWQRFRSLALASLEAAYRRMGVQFDEYLCESQVKPETLEEVMATLKEKDIAEESDGHMVINFAKYSDVKKGLGSVVVRYRNGSSTYLLRDVAAAIDRERAFGFDKMIYVVCSRQDLHISQVFCTLDLMGRSDLREKLQHVGFGRIQNFSEQLGGVRTLDAIIDRSAELMREAIKAELLAEQAKEGGNAGGGGDGDGDTSQVEAVQVASIGDTAAISAILDQDMSHRRSTNSSFDPKRMVSLAGYTGLQLQECHAMLQLGIAELQAQVQADEETPVDYSILKKEDPAELLRMMAQYPEMTSSVFKSLEPSIVLSYLHRLAEAAKTCLNSEEEAVDEDEEDGDEDGEKNNDKEGEEDASGKQEPTIGQLKARLSLYENARQVLENGMRLLNMPVVA